MENELLSRGGCCAFAIKRTVQLAAMYVITNTGSLHTHTLLASLELTLSILIRPPKHWEINWLRRATGKEAIDSVEQHSSSSSFVHQELRGGGLKGKAVVKVKPLLSSSFRRRILLQLDGKCQAADTIYIYICVCRLKRGDALLDCVAGLVWDTTGAAGLVSVVEHPVLVPSLDIGKSHKRGSPAKKTNQAFHLHWTSFIVGNPIYMQHRPISAKKNYFFFLLQAHQIAFHLRHSPPL